MENWKLSVLKERRRREEEEDNQIMVFINRFYFVITIRYKFMSINITDCIFIDGF